MADTGSPWNLPYPLPTDLVKDGADAIKDLAEAAATSLSAIPVLAGTGTNVVYSVKTDVFTTTNTAYTATGLSATITPTSASSKVLAIAVANGSASDVSGAGGAGVRISRSGSAMDLGDAAGTRTRIPANLTYTPDRGLYSATLVWLDSPATTSATTYIVDMRRYGNSTAKLNASVDDLDNGTRARSTSYIVLIEVAG
jgi:hypothetical protein